MLSEANSPKANRPAGRKIIVISMITLDGVMQSPGGPDENTSGGFKKGGWVAPYGDEVGGKIFEKELWANPTDYLLGRKTFEIFARYWPKADLWKGINEGTKYVLSKTMIKSDWKNSVFLKSLADIKELKKSNGPDIQVHGSGELVQLLLKNDLVDELWLRIFPLTLGEGQKLFESGTVHAAFKLIESTVTTTGVIMTHYQRAGEVKTGTLEIKTVNNELSVVAKDIKSL